MDARRFGRFRYDAATRTLSLDGQPMPLQARTAALLDVLLARAPELIARDELFAALWPDGFVEDGNLPQQVYHLRKALEGDPDVRIETVRGQGYRIVAPPPRAIAPPRWAAWHPAVVRRAAVALLALAATIGAVAVPSSTVRGKEVVLPSAAATAHRLGVFYFQRRNHGGSIQAMKEFARTVELAPNAPQGYSGRGLMEVVSASVFAQMPNASPYVYSGAEQDARKALGLGEDSSAHAVLGFIALRRDADVAVASGQFRRAIELDPNDSVAHEWYGITLLYAGKLAEARVEFEEALRTDPTCSINLYWLAVAQFYEGNFETAKRTVNHIFALEPYPMERWGGLALLSAIAEMQGDVKTAASIARQIAREADDDCYRDTTMFRLARLPGGAAAGIRSPAAPSCGHTANDSLAALTVPLVLRRDDEAIRILREERRRDPWDTRFALLYDSRLNHLRERADFRALLNG